MSDRIRQPPQNAAWKAFDILILLLVGLTGPWSLVLVPLVLVFWWYRRQRWSLVMAGVLGVCALIQGFELLTHAERPVTPLGATPLLFLRLVAGQIYMSALWGQNSFAKHAGFIPALAVLVAGTMVICYGSLKLPLEMKLFISFALLTTTAALSSPLIAGPKPRWLLLAIDEVARYWFFPMLALVWCLLWAASGLGASPQSLRLFSFACFALMLRAIWHDWHYPPWPNQNFGKYVIRFESAAPGAEVTIPICPPGFVMKITKQ